MVLLYVNVYSSNMDYQLELPAVAGMGLEGPEPATAGGEADCPILD